jgi:hypothetical protein
MVTPGGSDIASLILPPSEPGSYRRPRFLFGEMLEEQIPHEGGRPKLSHDVIVSPKLNELGISLMQSHRWQLSANDRGDAGGEP